MTAASSDARRADVVQPSTHGVRVLLSACAATLVCSLVVHLCMGRPALIGIDDANITQTYASHIARGHGYVYHQHGERVEGSTSFLWTMLNAGAFLLRDEPEPLLLALCLALTALSVLAALELATLLARAWTAQAWLARCVVLVCLAATPSFVSWSVFTLMDVALWSAVFLWLLVLLARRVLSPGPWTLRDRLALASVAAAAVLTRPEGALVAPALICLSAWLSWRRVGKRHLRDFGLVLATCCLAAAALTAFRLSYFGYPVPNTFYAKVSSDLLSQAGVGFKYLIDYALSTPYFVLYLLGWLGLLASLGMSTLDERATRDAVDLTVLILVALAGLWLLYASLGGDHFVMHRFYQPGSLLLPLSLALWTCRAEAWLMRLLRSATGRALVSVSALCFIGVPMLAFKWQPGLRGDIEIAVDGRHIAQALSGLSMEPSVAVIAAGGIARRYPGKIYDLVGLNWVEMAHADPRKTGGFRNHGGFDPNVFWRATPDMLAFVGSRCGGADGAFVLSAGERSILKGLDSSQRFHQQYRRAALGCYLTYVRRDLTARLASSDSLRLLADEPQAAR